MKLFKRGLRWYLDVTVNGARYQEALGTTDHREAKRLAGDRLSEIKQGKGISAMGREFARQPFREAVKIFLAERSGRVSERTARLERERSGRLIEFFKDRPVNRIKADDIAAFQRWRRAGGPNRQAVAGRTVNMELGVLRQIMRRARLWLGLAEDVTFERETVKPIGRVLTHEEKEILFETAASNDRWFIVRAAAALAASTTCRGVELKGLRWQDIDLDEAIIHVRRSKTEAGHRSIPLNADGREAIRQLRERAEALGIAEPEHFVFPACEGQVINPRKSQVGWRTAWRSLVRATARQVGRNAAKTALSSGGTLTAAKRAYRKAASAIAGFRFHDLRHQAVTELAEAGAPDATLMAVAGHMSRRMMEHYSHVRMAAKREAVDKLASGLMKSRKPFVVRKVS